MTEPKSTPTWLEALKVSMALFTPAFVLIVGGFFLWNPSIVNKLTNSEEKLVKKVIEEQVNQLIDDEIKKQIQEEARKQITNERINILAQQKGLLNLDKESPLGRTYVTGEISKQAEDQAKKAVKEEIGQAKGDLFGQITFPVVFAIASIFAAFAVKDILTEILKKEEEIALRNKITETLKERLGIPEEDDKSHNSKPEKLWSIVDRKVNQHINGLTESNRKIVDKLEQDFSKKLAWLEYEIASLALYTEDPKIQEKDLTKHMCRIDRVLNNLVEIGAGDKDQIKILRDFNDMYFVSIMDVMPNLKDCNDNYDRIGVVLARAKLTLDSIKKDGLPPGADIIFTSLTNEINLRKNKLNTQKEGLEQGSTTNAPIRFPKG